LSADDDIAWLEALAGRAAPPRAEDATSASRDVIEAAALRELIRDLPEPETPHAPALDPSRESELIERARAQGLLAARIAPRTRWGRTGVLAVAAGIVLAAIGLTLLRTGSPPTETLRGDGRVHLKTDDPAALKRQLTEELRAAGAQVTGYERLGRPGIDVDLPKPLTPEIRRILEKHDIPVPADDELIVEFGIAGQP
jgi:hypothetical protein